MYQLQRNFENLIKHNKFICYLNYKFIHSQFKKFTWKMS